jgi:hypothetical protein
MDTANESDIHPASRSERRLGLLAALCLIAPVLMAVFFLNDEWLLERFFTAFTPFPALFMPDSPQKGAALSASQSVRAKIVYRERIAAHALVLFWPCRWKAPLLALFLSMAAVFGRRRFFPYPLGPKARRSASYYGGFAILAYCGALLSALDASIDTLVLFAPAFAAWTFLVFALNFTVTRAPDKKTAAILLIFSGPSHVLGPALHARLVAEAFFPEKRRARTVLIRAGQLAACVLGFGLGAFVFLSHFRPAVSPGAMRLLAMPDLYGAFIDTKDQNLIVTRKKNTIHTPDYVFSLNDPTSPPREFFLPSAEVEDMAFDGGRDLFYQVDRKTKNLLSISAKTFRTVSSTPLAADFPGSARLCLAKDSGRLFIAFEGGTLSAVDLAAGKVVENIILPCDPNLAADAYKHTIFLHLYSLRKVYAMDAGTMRVTACAPSPPSDERPVISLKRRELYIPDIACGRIWVYGLPDLELLRRLPARLGVRALAPDDANGRLLAASFIAGDLDVMDPASGRVLSSFHVGPYCRRLALDTSRRLAYITLTLSGLYCVDYGSWPP